MWPAWLPEIADRMFSARNPPQSLCASNIWQNLTILLVVCLSVSPNLAFDWLRFRDVEPNLCILMHASIFILQHMAPIKGTQLSNSGLSFLLCRKNDNSDALRPWDAWDVPSWFGSRLHGTSTVQPAFFFGQLELQDDALKDGNSVGKYLQNPGTHPGPPWCHPIGA